MKPLVLFILLVEKDFVSEGIKLQFIIHGNFTKLRNVKGSKASTTAHQNRLSCFTRRKRIFFILSYGKVVGLFRFKFFKHTVNRVFVFLIILSDFHSIDELKQSREILFFGRCFIVDVANQGAVQKRFRFRPELITGFTVSFRVGDEGCYQLQNVLFAVNVSKWVIMHGLLEVDSVKNLDFVVVAFKQLADLAYDLSFRVGDHI